MNKSTQRIAVGTAIFGAIGYVAGILTAPKSGTETRSSIRHGADKTMSEAEKQLKKLHTELNDTLGDVKSHMKDFKNDASDSKGREALIGEVVDKASHTRQKTREILSALHDGNANDKDLKNAVKDASKAIRSLRSYLKK